jgi:hypothetical protein
MNVTWSPVAEDDLRTIPWRHAARVDRAVMNFAKTGRGDIQRDESGRRLRLIVGGYAVLMTVDPVDGLFVGRVVRR